MKIVVDANILIAALIRDSTTRKLIFISDDILHCPIEILNEVNEHKSLILEKSKLSEKDYDSLLNQLLSHITIVSEYEVKRNLPKAAKLMEKIDIEDAPFITAALSIGGCIWSEDRHFKQQDKVAVFTTLEMMKIIR